MSRCGLCRASLAFLIVAAIGEALFGWASSTVQGADPPAAPRKAAAPKQQPKSKAKGSQQQPKGKAPAPPVIEAPPDISPPMAEHELGPAPVPPGVDDDPAPPPAPNDPAPQRKPKPTKPPSKADGQPHLVVQVGHRVEVSAMDISPNGKIIATGDINGRMYLWDATSGKELRELRPPENDAHRAASTQTIGVTSIGFSPDGALVAATLRDHDARHGEIYLWDTNTGESVSTGDNVPNAPCAFTADSKKMFTAAGLHDRDGGAWKLINEEPLRLPSEGPLLTMALGGAWIAKAYQSGEVVIVDLESGKVVRELLLTALNGLRAKNEVAAQESEAVTALAIVGEEETQLLLGGRSGTVALRDLNANATRWLVALRDPVESLSVSPDNQWIIAHTAHFYYLLNAKTGKTARRFAVGRAVICGKFSPNGAIVATGHGDSILRLWDAKSGKLLKRLEGAFGTIMDTAFVDKGETIAAADVYGVVSVWNVVDGKLTRQINGGKEFDKPGDEAPAAPGIPAAPAPAAPPFEPGACGESAAPPRSDDDIAPAPPLPGEAGPPRVQSPPEATLPPSEVLQTFSGDTPYGLGAEPYHLTTALRWSYAESPPMWFFNRGKSLLFGGKIGTSHKGYIDIVSGDSTHAFDNDQEVGGFLAISPDGSLIVASRVISSADGLKQESQYWLYSPAKKKFTSKVASRGAFGPSGPQVGAISTDNAWLAIDDGGTNLDVINIATGKVARTIKSGEVMSVSFSPRGDQIGIACINGLAQIWDRASGKLLRTLIGHAQDVTSVNFSPDGKLALTTCVDETARIWNAESGKQLLLLHEDDPTLAALDFRPDGSLLQVTRSGRAVIGECPSGKTISEQSYARASDMIDSVLTTADGVALVNTRVRARTRALGPQLSIHHLAAGIPPLVMQDSAKSQTTYGQIASFLPNSSLILSVSRAGVVRTWNEHGQASSRKLEEAKYSTGDYFMFSDRFQYLAAANERATGNSLRLWNLKTGKLLPTPEDGMLPDWFDDRPDDKVLFRFDEQTGLGLTAIDAKTKRVLKKFPKAEKSDISNDGKFLATAQEDGLVQIWDTSGFKELNRIQFRQGRQAVERAAHGGGGDNPTVEEGLKQPVRIQQIKFSPSGKYLLVYDGATFRLINRVAGKVQCELEWAKVDSEELNDQGEHGSSVLMIGNVTFSPDERSLAGTTGPYLDSAPQHGGLAFWDLASGKTTQIIVAPTSSAGVLSFSADSRLILQSGADDATYLWNRDTGKLECRLIMVDDENWAVVDEQGRFDAANGGDIDGMHWIVGNEPIALKQLKARYYEPGLLAKVLGFNKEARLPAVALEKVALFPDARLEPLAKGSTKLKVDLTNRGGGIGRVQVFVNGKELLADARGPKPDPAAKQTNLTVDLSAGHLMPGVPNRVKVVAWNAEGYLSSRGLDLEWTPAGVANSSPPHLYAIVVGVSNYASPNLNLRFAAKDADVIGRTLEVAASRLFGAERVHVKMLNSLRTDPAEQPTKSNLRKAFEAARAAKPTDILVVYLAGHGVAFQHDGDLYCYLTADARTTDTASLADPAVLESTTLTSAELVEWIKRIPALNQVMLLDTCAAGAAAKKLIDHRELSGDQVRALDRLKDITSFHVLMGCAADRVSYEASQYGQGLLTYALLQGMKGGALRQGEFVDVVQLFQFAVDEVPRLAINIGGIQKPDVMSPRGSSFDLGQLTSADRAAIPLANERPRLLRPLLSNVADGDDNLRLLPLLVKRLIDVSYATERGPGKSPPLVYVDADDLSGAIRPVGQYTVKGSKVSVKLLIKRDGKTLDTLTVEGTPTELDALAVKMSDAITKAIAKTVK